MGQHWEVPGATPWKIRARCLCHPWLSWPTSHQLAFCPQLYHGLLLPEEREMDAGEAPTAEVYYKYLGKIASLPNSFAYNIEAFHDLIPMTHSSTCVTPNQSDNKQQTLWPSNSFLYMTTLFITSGLWCVSKCLLTGSLGAKSPDE